MKGSELAAVATLDQRCDADLELELIGLVRLALPMHSTSGACSE